MAAATPSGQPYWPSGDPDSLSRQVLSAALEVHRALGPGLLESSYEGCLAFELALQGLAFKRQQRLPVAYKGYRIDCGYRLDLVVEERLLVEIKAVQTLLPIHEAQVLTYLKLSSLPTGLLINFNVSRLRDGIRRLGIA
ncbi:MAG TPA: GxxExxY protein [Fimbriimonas sp.]